MQTDQVKDFNDAQAIAKESVSAGESSILKRLLQW